MTAINLIVIKTDKLEEQAAFYTALGLSLDYHQHGNGPFHYATKGMPVIEIYPLPKSVSSPDNTTRLGFTVEDLDLTIQHLIAMNIKVITAPAISEWGYTAVVQDYDGRKIELVESR